MPGSSTELSPSGGTAVSRGQRLRAAIIGTGKISEEHLKFLSTDAGVELAGVCDLSPLLADYAARKFKAAKAFSSSATMLAETRPDVVHVLTPAHTHVSLVTEALNAGAHVIVEKPVAPTNAEFRKLFELAEARGKRIVEDHNYRFNEPVLEVERLIEAGELGELREVDVRMVLSIREKGSRFADKGLPHPAHNMPAGVVHEFLTHYCYLALRFMPGLDFDGPSPPRIRAAWSKHGDEPEFPIDDLDAVIVSGPIHSRIRFSSHAGPDCFTMWVRGTTGWAELNLFQPYVRVVRPRKGGEQLSPLVNQWMNGFGLVRSSFVGFKDKLLQKTTYEGLATFLRRTYAALRENREPPVTFKDMDLASRLVDELVEERNRF